MRAFALVGLSSTIALSANAFIVGSGHHPLCTPHSTVVSLTMASRSGVLVALSESSTSESESITMDAVVSESNGSSNDDKNLSSLLNPQELLQTADSIFDTMDTNHDGSISNEELRTHLARIGYSPESIRLLFTALDKNADGVISREEMRFAFETYEVSSLYKAFGVGDEDLTEEMYSATVESIRSSADMDSSKKTAPELVTKLADLIFNMIDTDNSGEIDGDELKLHFMKHGDFSTFREVGHVSTISVESVMKALDLNDDGVISREEMRNGFRQYDLEALSKALGLQVTKTSEM